MKAALFLIIVVFIGCNDSRSRNSRYQIQSIDISSDDKKVLVLSTRDATTTLFEINTRGGSPALILKTTGDEIFSNPRYSPDGKKIVFIKRLKKSIWESTVCIANSDGTDVRELPHHGELVTEAVFSAKGNEVLFCSAKQYNTIRKKGETDVHGFDIYTIGIDGQIATKLSQLGALGIDNLSEVEGKYILFHMTSGKKSGIYSFEKDNPGRVLRIFPANGTYESNLLGNPGYAQDFIVFTAQSELYAMNLTSRKADLIYDAKGGHLIELLRGFHTQPRVLFKKFDEAGLLAVNTDGTEVGLIDVEFPE